MDNNQKRWYDKNETVSYMVTLMEKADEKVQIECAKLIIEKAKEYGVKVADNQLEESVKSFFRRWYDKNKVVQESFEYLKNCSFDVQKGIAYSVIEKLEDL